MSSTSSSSSPASSSSSSSSSSYSSASSSPSSFPPAAAASEPVSVPLAWGSIAFQMGRSRAGTAQEHSHRWMVFVRGAANQDITGAVAKVVFTLHHTIRDHVREVLRPPFQVTETGYGNFELLIAVHFHAALGAPGPLVLKHTLKLFHESQSAPPERPVLSEFFDEVVFNHVAADAPPPPPSLLPAPPLPVLVGAGAGSGGGGGGGAGNMVVSGGDDETAAAAVAASASAVAAAHARLRAPPGDAPPYPFQEHLTLFSAEADLAALRQARVWVRERLEENAERFKRREAEADALRQQCAAMGLV